MALSEGETLFLELREESGVGEARRAARRLAGASGMDEVVGERAAIVTTEAARNVVRHGGSGFVALRALDGAPGLEILAVDRGPGIADVGQALRDGHSTAGTPGQGLGAMRRLASRFDLWSAPGKGTVLLAEVCADAAPPLDPTVAGINVPCRGESVSGDAWVVVRAQDRTVIAVADGIGHGVHAHEAARTAVAAVTRTAQRPPGEIVAAAHDALRATRGAAIAVLSVDGDGAVRYAGLGNVSAAIVGPREIRRLASLAGTAGHQIRHVREFVYEWPAGACLVMHSDGIATHWSLDGYAGLASRSPALVAAVLYRDFQRGRDDATVLAAVRRGR